MKNLKTYSAAIVVKLADADEKFKGRPILKASESIPIHFMSVTVGVIGFLVARLTWEL